MGQHPAQGGLGVGQAEGEVVILGIALVALVVGLLVAREPQTSVRDFLAVADAAFEREARKGRAQCLPEDNHA